MKFKKTLTKTITLLLLITSLYGSTNLEPKYSFEVSGGVTDMIEKNNNLYISTNEGIVNIFNLKTKKLKEIKTFKIKDFMGDEINPKIYSIDIIDTSIIFPIQSKRGYNEIYTYDISLKKLIKVIDFSEKKAILRVKYITKNLILYSTISNQFFLYDIKNKEYIWDIQVSQSKYSYFVLNEDKTMFLVSDESGDLKQLSVKDGHLIRKYSGKNLDNIFQVDWKQDTIITGGQDMRTIVYNTKNKTSYLKKGKFLIYSVGLSPDGLIGAYSKYENNDIEVFNTKYKNAKYRLINNKMNISKILIKNNKEIFVSNDSNQINYYKLED